MSSPEEKGAGSAWAWLVPSCALALMLGVTVFDPTPVRSLRNATFDQFQRWYPRAYANPPVRIIDIDDESLRRIGQWPWPRQRVAGLVTDLQALSPSAIALDIMFSEPDRGSPGPTRDSVAASPPAPDEVLARALRGSNAAIGFAMTPGRAPRGRSDAGDDGLSLKSNVAVLGGDPAGFVPAYGAAIPNLAGLQEAAAGQGAITLVSDDDGIVRRVPMVLSLEGRLVPSLAAEALRLSTHATTYVVRSDEHHGGVVDVRIGDRTIETDSSGAVWVHYSTPHPERYIPAWRVLAHQVKVDEIRGAVLLLGTSAQGLMDLRFNPRGGVVPGVEIHAQALEQILSGQQLARPGWMPAVELLATLIGGLVVAALALTRGPVLATAGFLAVAGGLWAAAWGSFVGRHLLANPLVPTLALAFVFVPTTLLRHLLNERKQRWMRQAFSRYVSPNLLDYLIAHPESLTLGGKRQRCSFVFADLAGFTTLMETMDPTAAVTVLNGYLDRMIAIAFDHGGTLDRIVGDAVAIVFSAPVEQVDHERRALACALEMHAFARQYVQDLARSGVAFCDTRIGVHTGEVTVGNFGGGAIFDYRALGDPVNVAARLEGANKHLGTLMCVSDAILSACPGVRGRPIGRLRLAGRTEPVMAHEPLGDIDAARAPIDSYQRAFDLMHEEAAEALEAFESLGQSHPGDPLVKLHVARLRAGLRGDVVELTEK